MRFVIAVCACVSCGLARALCVCVRERDFQKAFFNTPLIKGKESLLFKKRLKLRKIIFEVEISDVSKILATLSIASTQCEFRKINTIIH